jgi:hypothetical protein
MADLDPDPRSSMVRPLDAHSARACANSSEDWGSVINGLRSVFNDYGSNVIVLHGPARKGLNRSHETAQQTRGWRPAVRFDDLHHTGCAEELAELVLGVG